MDPKIVTPILKVAVVAFAIYRRVRRTIGRQRFEPKRMQVRMVFLSIVGVGVLIYSGRNFELAGALIAGAVGGAAVGYFGLRHTKFETTREGQFYTPHTYIGLFISALFLGRLAYRFITLYPTMAAAHRGNEDPMAFQKSPLTLAIFGVVIGYYVAYYAGVIKVGRKLMVATEPDKSANPLAISPADRAD